MEGLDDTVPARSLHGKWSYNEAELGKKLRGAGATCLQHP